eukprot:7672437-Ditylum_brightwellii.AAC.1
MKRKKQKSKPRAKRKQATIRQYSQTGNETDTTQAEAKSEGELLEENSGMRDSKKIGEIKSP